MHGGVCGEGVHGCVGGRVRVCMVEGVGRVCMLGVCGW